MPIYFSVYLIIQDKGDDRIVPGADHSNGNLSYRFELERGEGCSKEQISVAVCGGCPVLQVGVKGGVN
jgi:hypothetical protein